MTAAKRSLGTTSFPNKKQFDKECSLKRNELRKLSNKKHKDPLNSVTSQNV